MGFTRIEFLLFLVAVVGLAWLGRTRVQRNIILVAASYYFYAYWDYRFCGLLILSTAVDFQVARWIAAREDAKTRFRLLLVSLGVNLGVLGFFKYFNFFIDSAAPILQSL